MFPHPGPDPKHLGAGVCCSLWPLGTQTQQGLGGALATPALGSTAVTRQQGGRGVTGEPRAPRAKNYPRGVARTGEMDSLVTRKFGAPGLWSSHSGALQVTAPPNHPPRSPAVRVPSYAHPRAPAPPPPCSAARPPSGRSMGSPGSLPPPQ